MMFSIVTLLIVALSPVISLGLAYFIFISFESGLGMRKQLLNPEKSEVI
jgi:hypothetical protein